ncbi:hypothetical protein CEXT_356131 [Caerostris extrusa]|uniref:Uncharacterized protein n=1 Tax=Caerostris extrusa TaxID=172846 RepID=A0AAV4VVN9_CAEEX|nr:hypothetical protein CEXT_356131 [Caerostris extrusa]
MQKGDSSSVLRKNKDEPLRSGNFRAPNPHDAPRILVAVLFFETSVVIALYRYEGAPIDGIHEKLVGSSVVAGVCHVTLHCQKKDSYYGLLSY